MCSLTSRHPLLTVAGCLRFEWAPGRFEVPGGPTASAIATETGPPGAAGDKFEVQQRGGGTLRLATIRSLAPGEGFTIAIAWPEGAVARPDPGDAWLAFIGDNPGILIGYALTEVLIVRSEERRGGKECVSTFRYRW